MSKHRQFPKKVFRVVYREDDMTPCVIEGEMISRSGSWFTIRRKDGTTYKVNGNHWSDTVLEAIQREAIWIMKRFSSGVMYSEISQIQAMHGLIDEAIEWGKLVGEVSAMAEQCKEPTP